MFRHNAHVFFSEGVVMVQDWSSSEDAASERKTFSERQGLGHQGCHVMTSGLRHICEHEKSFERDDFLSYASGFDPAQDTKDGD